jgi:hypothetical protein
MKYPTHIVVDTIDGYVFSANRYGVLFDKEDAVRFARERNAEMKPQHRTYAVFRLVSENVGEFG